MAVYRTSRNFTASIIDYITDELTSDWNNVSIVRSFQKVTTQNLPCICVRVGNTQFNKAEIGSSSLIRNVLIYCDIFAENGGQKEDLTDWLISTIKEGMPYYNYTTTKANRVTTVTGKVANGRINITNIEVREINFDLERSQLDPRDRERVLITLTATLGKVE